jgi:prepilin-type N-terminal cleavage/methylation domain-containing protein
MNKQQKGFTLIELLIVIVIIGILAGVLIAIIDPTKQQNRARDANVQATMNKAVLATASFNSAYGRYPDGIELIDSLNNACPAGLALPTCTTGTISAGAGCAASNNNCAFHVSGNELGVGTGQGCNDLWRGIGAGQCHFYYERISPGGPLSTEFNIYAKSFGLTDTMFRYNNLVGEIQECDVNGSAASCT